MHHFAQKMWLFIEQKYGIIEWQSTLVMIVWCLQNCFSALFFQKGVSEWCTRGFFIKKYQVIIVIKSSGISTILKGNWLHFSHNFEAWSELTWSLHVIFKFLLDFLCVHLRCSLEIFRGTLGLCGAVSCAFDPFLYVCVAALGSGTALTGCRKFCCSLPSSMDISFSTCVSPLNLRHRVIPDN
jgi:hypothetical protein